MSDRAKYALDGHGRRQLRFFCPGCQENHVVSVHGEGRPNWTFNGDLERPTLSPSILVTTGHYVPGHRAGAPCWCSTKDRVGEDWDFSCGVCHSFVRDGRIEFLNDCTHALAGQTVDLRTLDGGADAS